jgi:hypothetical protein
MPGGLKSRMAAFGMLAVFFIPIYTATLRGLTHVVTCQQETATPLTMVISDDGQPVLLGSETITRGQDNGLCGGLFLNTRALIEGKNKVALVLPITNRTKYEWRGSVKLLIGPTSIPVGIGAIPAGGTATDTIHLTLDPGTHEVRGSVLIGP